MFERASHQRLRIHVPVVIDHIFGISLSTSCERPTLLRDHFFYPWSVKMGPTVCTVHHVHLNINAQLTNKDRRHWSTDNVIVCACVRVCMCVCVQDSGRRGTDESCTAAERRAAETDTAAGGSTAGARQRTPDTTGTCTCVCTVHWPPYKARQATHPKQSMKKIELPWVGFEQTHCILRQVLYNWTISWLR